MKTIFSTREYLAALVLAAGLYLLPATGTGGESGLRLDQRVVQAAARLVPDAPADAELVPGLTLTEGAEGYVLTRYAVMVGDEEKGAFFRVRTVTDGPERDVAVRFDADGTLLAVYDLNPPRPKPVKDKGDKAKAGAAAASAAEKADPRAADPKLRQKAAAAAADRVGSEDVVSFLVGRKPAVEAESMAALLRGIARAATLLDKAARDKLPEIPVEAFSFTKADAPRPKLPAFALRTLDGKPFTQADLGTGFKAVFFTALQSEACRKMNAGVAAVLGKNPRYAAGFTWVLADAPDVAAALAKKLGLRGRAACDPESAAAAAFGVVARPTLLVYDEGGLLVGVVNPDNLKNLPKALELLGKK